MAKNKLLIAILLLMLFTGCTAITAATESTQIAAATASAETAKDQATEVYTGLTGAPSPFSASRIIADWIIWIGPDATGTVQVYTGYFIEDQELGVFVAPRHDLQNYTFYPLPEKVGGWELGKKSGLEITRYEGSVLTISTPNGDVFTFDVINRQYLRKVDGMWVPYPTVTSN